MTKTKFTPGPWVYDKDEETITAGGMVIVCFDLSDFPYPDEADHNLDEIDPESEANYHLMAAAPALYAALCDVRDFLRSNGYDTRLADAVLAKARGETPA